MLPNRGTKQKTKSTHRRTSCGFKCQLSTHEAHRVGNNVVFGHFTNFGGRSVIGDKHECLAEYSWMTFDVFLVSRGGVGTGSTAIRDISGNSNQERWGLTACLKSYSA